MTLSKEVLRKEIVELIKETNILKQGYNTELHVHLVTRTNTILEQVFGVDSRYYKMFRSIQWDTTKLKPIDKGVLYVFTDINKVERDFYVKGLDAAIGIFRAIIDELDSIDNSEVFLRNLFWNHIHPEIRKVSESRFNANHFADSVEAALKHINSTVKEMVKRKTGEEYDGAELMNRAFSPKTPIILLADPSNESGKNIQLGFMQIFAGAMTGIRNPKAHDNINISADRAMHYLFLASTLMYKLDERFS